VTNYHYRLAHEVDGSDQSHLIDALEDEEFALFEEMGEDAVNQQIRSGELKFEKETNERLGWFRDVIAVLSIHLSEYIYGLEIAEDRETGKRHVEILKYIGRKGDVIAVPLVYTIEFPSGEITPGLEDTQWLETNWKLLPRWAQDGFRIKFPPLRRL
jgi:hypothetical protein